MIKKIILIGGGGHCKSIIDSIVTSNEYEIMGILDIECNIGKRVCSIPIIGTDNELVELYKSGIEYAFITIGTIGNWSIVKNLYDKLCSIGFKIPTIIDKTAILAKNVDVGPGCYIGKGVIVNSDASIGEMTVINTGSIVEHDCKVESFVHISPSTTICGNVKIDKYTHVGAGSTIVQGISIGRETLIGAGSVVVSNIQSNIKAFGVPCKEIGEWKSIFL